MTDRYAEIDEVIRYIKQHLYDPLPLARLAAHAAYSPYHFTRIFKERMGLSPLYYVSSLRLQKAKDLLLHTHLSIRDIGLEIGQQSLGTFTTRFTERVGVTPSEFRNSPQLADSRLQSLRQLDRWQEPLSLKHARVEGAIETEVPFDGFVLIGLFAKPIPEGIPLYGTLVSSLHHFCLSGVQPGVYYLMATSISWSADAKDTLLPYTTLRTRSREPVVVRAGAPVPFQQVKLYLPRLDDPPILISLSLLMDNFLSKVQHPKG